VLTGGTTGRLRLGVGCKNRRSYRDILVEEDGQKVVRQ
jgi:hypothetical protein